MDEYIPKVLVYDDKEDQRKNVKLLLEEHFEVYTASPETLANEIRDTIDVIVTDVEIIEGGKAARQGYDDVEKVLKTSCMVRPVIVYTNVADMAKIKNKEFFFGYVERRGYDWVEQLIDKIRRAYAQRFPQRSKMFGVWCKKYGIIDKVVSEDGIQRLVKVQETQPEDLEYARNHTYQTVINWLDNEHLEEGEAEEYEEILFCALKNIPDFVDTYT